MYKVVEFNGKPHLIKRGIVTIGQRSAGARYVEIEGKLTKPTKWGGNHRDAGISYCSFFYKDWNYTRKSEVWTDLGEVMDLGGFKIGDEVKMERQINITKGIITLNINRKPYGVHN